jgi:hypothetical protein
MDALSCLEMVGDECPDSSLDETMLSQSTHGFITRALQKAVLTQTP